MFKFVTIYRRVDDEELLETFFAETHLRLSEQLPGLVKSEVSRVSGQPGGESRFHLMYELYFKTGDDFQAAILTEPGAQLVQALKAWVDARIITWFFSESFEEEAGVRRTAAGEEE